VEDGGSELDLVPAKVAQFGCPQAMAEGDQDHGGIPVPVSIGLRRLDQSLDLAWSEVLPGSELGVRTPTWSNCS
jgi:hypothetical protein